MIFRFLPISITSLYIVPLFLDDCNRGEYIGFGGEQVTEKYYSYYNSSSKQLVIGASVADVQKEVGEGVKVSSTANAWNSIPGRTTATYVKFVGKISPATTASWFVGRKDLTKIEGIENLDTSHVTDMSNMFNGCKVLTGLDVSGFNTGSVTSMKMMFEECNNVTELDVSGFDTRNVTTMERMFKNCSSLKSLDNDGDVIFDVSKFDTSKVTIMANMFKECSALESLNVSKFDTSKVGSMAYMFQNCSELKSLDLSSFDITKSSAIDMLNGDTKLKTLTVPSINTGISVNLPAGNTYWDTTFNKDVSGSVNSDYNKHKLLLHNEHDPQKHAAKPPTCTEDGTQEYYQCAICEKLFADEACKTELKAPTVERARGHTEGEWIVGVEASCVSLGSRHKECTVCKAILKLENIPATGHVMGSDYKVISAPTCTVNGVGSGTCEKCKTHLEYIEIPATGHKMQDGYEELKAPTCTETGIGKGNCTKCEYIGLFEIPATDHTWEKDYTVDVEPTCTKEGSESIHCENCAATKDSRAIAVKEHNYGEIQTYAATCETDGYTYHICNDCGFSAKVDTIKAKGHDYGEVKTHPVTCETDGDTYHKCTVCGHTETIEEIKAPGYKESGWIIDAEADCVTEGSRHKECETCGKILSREVIKEKEHTFGDWERANDQKHKRTCACGVVEYANHNWDEWHIHDDESREHICKDCGEIGLSIHTWDKGEVITVATHLKEGAIKYTCTCGATKTEVIPKIAEHTFGDWEDIDETQHKRVCECGEEEIQVHAWSKWHIHDSDSRERECDPMSIKWTEKSGELSNEKFSSNGSKTIVMRVWTERVVETMDVSEQSILQFRYTPLYCKSHIYFC